MSSLKELLCETDKLLKKLQLIIFFLKNFKDWDANLKYDELDANLIIDLNDQNNNKKIN